MVPDQDESQDRRDALVRELFGDGGPDDLAGRLLTTAEVAMLFQVTERTVSDWATKGLVPSVRTPGGRRRYPAEAVIQLLSEQYGP